MKKLGLLATIVLIIILAATCLVGCSTGDPIEFSVEELVLTGSTSFDDEHASAKKIESREELIEYLELGDSFDMSLIEQFNDAYFEESAVIVLSHSVYDDESYEIKSVNIKGTKLTVKLSRKYTESMFTQMYYDFITINKADVENVTQCSVSTSSMKFSFSF